MIAERSSILQHPDVSIANVYEWLTRHSAWSLPGGIHEGGRALFTWVRCPSASHPDAHPSAYLNHKKNWVECRACGFEGGIFAMVVGAGEAENYAAAAKWVESQLGIKPAERPALDEQPDMRHFGGIGLPNERKTATYTYTDLHGKRLYWIHRYDGDPGADGRSKRFTVHHQTSGGRYKKGYGPDGKVPYRLTSFARAHAERRVLIMPEGEKCADAIEDLDLLATTIPFGTNSKMIESWKVYFRLVPAVLQLTDSDEEGRAAAAHRAAWLKRNGVFVRTVDLAPERNDGFDIWDWKRERRHISAVTLRTELTEMLLRPALR